MESNKKVIKLRYQHHSPLRTDTKLVISDFRKMRCFLKLRNAKRNQTNYRKSYEQKSPGHDKITNLMLKKLPLKGLGYFAIKWKIATLILIK